jgi:hypothetical protein
MNIDVVHFECSYLVPDILHPERRLQNYAMLCYARKIKEEKEEYQTLHVTSVHWNDFRYQYAWCVPNSVERHGVSVERRETLFNLAQKVGRDRGLYLHSGLPISTAKSGAPSKVNFVSFQTFCDRLHFM